MAQVALHLQHTMDDRLPWKFPLVFRGSDSACARWARANGWRWKIARGYLYGGYWVRRQPTESGLPLDCMLPQPISDYTLTGPIDQAARCYAVAPAAGS